MALSKIAVKSVMDKVFPVVEGSPIGDVVHNMREHDFGYVVVISSNGQYRGVVDESFFTDAVAHDIDLSGVVVDDDAMISVPTVQDGASLYDVARLMDKESKSLVVVLDTSVKPVGAVTEDHIRNAVDDELNPKKG